MKKYTPEEAARAVLQKAEQMLKSSKVMAKAVAGPMEPQTAASTPAPMAMSQDQTPPDGVQAEPNAVAEVPRNGNPAWGTEPGCHKLSKFMGRREERKKGKAVTNG